MYTYRLFLKIFNVFFFSFFDLKVLVLGTEYMPATKKNYELFPLMPNFKSQTILSGTTRQSRSISLVK